MIRPFNVDDLIATKDGRTMSILTVKFKDGTYDVQRMEAVDKTAAVPMRTTIHWDNFRRVIKKAQKAYDPELKRWCQLQADNTYKPIDRRIQQEKDYLKLFKLRMDRRVKQEATV